ncbi:MAG: phage virion morphogenesis protein [Mucinivorans sp.]
METFDQVRKKIAAMSENVRRVAPVIIAQTAVEHYKERFTKKEWDGVQWVAAKDPPSYGSLMVRSGALMSTIRPKVISDNEVIISAGGAKVPYARIHNQGGVIQHPGGTASRKIDNRFVWVANNKIAGQDLPRTKAHKITIPQRQFMGYSKILNKKILERLKPLCKL